MLWAHMYSIVCKILSTLWREQNLHNKMIINVFMYIGTLFKVLKL